MGRNIMLFLVAVALGLAVGCGDDPQKVAFDGGADASADAAAGDAEVSVDLLVATDSAADASPEVGPDATADGTADTDSEAVSDVAAEGDAIAEPEPDAALDTEIPPGPDATNDDAADTLVDAVSDAAADAADTQPDVASDAAADAQPDASPTLCHATPRPADAPRTVVYALPYTASGTQSPTWARGVLTADATLTLSPGTFTMGRAVTGHVRFTPDGALGFVAQGDGSVGVLRVAPDGSVTPLIAALKGDFYAEDVVIHPDGDRGFIVHGGYPEHGGGLYPFTIGCDDSIHVGERVLTTKLLHGFAYLPDDPSLAAAIARELPGAPPGEEAHLLDLGPPITRLGGAPTFDDVDAQVSVATLSADGSHFFVGDISEFSGSPNRIVVIDLSGATPKRVQTLSPILDPFDIVAAPDDDAVLVVSGYGDALIPFAYDPASPQPLGAQGPSVTSSLPGHAALVSRGEARGVVLVSEVKGIRMVRFAGGAALDSLGLVSTGGLPGAIGVQP